MVCTSFSLLGISPLTSFPGVFQITSLLLVTPVPSSIYNGVVVLCRLVPVDSCIQFHTFSCHLNLVSWWPNEYLEDKLVVLAHQIVESPE